MLKIDILVKHISKNTNALFQKREFASEKNNIST